MNEHEHVWVGPLVEFVWGGYTRETECCGWRWTTERIPDSAVDTSLPTQHYGIWQPPAPSVDLGGKASSE